MLYRKCKIYNSKDRQKKAVKYIDVESDKPLDNVGAFSEGSAYAEGTTYQVITSTEFEYKNGIYNIEIPGMGELKITGYTKMQENGGRWKRKYRYTLTLQG